jgi:nitrite reductase (NO-forming)
MPHNIDLHAATGPGGGAVSSFTPPGKETTFSFQALNPGLFVYHCATAPVGMHIAHGMYGLILVEPEEGLPKVDREYYVMQGDFYTKGNYGSPGLQPFDMDKALIEQPDYVVFNGSVGALTGRNSLQARQNETVRLFIGNGGPNLVSSFHVIGEIFDRVYDEAGSAINRNVQTTLIPAGGATIAEMKMEVPGEFIIVDHSIFRAFNKGALAKISVEGKENKDVYSGEQRQTVYLPEGSAIQGMPDEEAPEILATNVKEQIELGGNVYRSVCAACHMTDGRGVPGAFPPLATSDFLNADVDRAIEIVARGLQGEVKVNGLAYNNVMPNLNLSHEDIANVLSYVYSEWKNNGTVVSRTQVEAVLSKAK